MPSKDTTNKMIAAAALVIIAGGVVSYGVYGSQPVSDQHTVVAPTTMASSSVMPTAVISTPLNVLPTITAVSVPGSYKDGAYTAVGNYTSPGGAEHMNVTLTLKNDIVVDAQVTPQATLPISQRFQGIFAADYKSHVIGKNIKDLNLTKISGSSLTPQGFNDALAKIKAQAQS